MSVTKQLLVFALDQFSRNATTCTQENDCPIWTDCNYGYCECKETLNDYKVFKCDRETLQLSVLKCHCVTYDNETKDITEGICIENCKIGNNVYVELPLNVSELNEFMCEERWNRTGRLCGKCLPGHSPLAYFYDMRCVKCPEGNKNVWKYILVAFGPLTIFYFLVLLLKINATSSHLHGYLIYSQIISTPAFSREMNFIMYTFKYEEKVPILIIATLYGIWNLDFFREFYTDICLDVSVLTILALDYAVAIYPLLLTVISYFLIELHARNCRIVVILGKPFHYLLTRFRINWDSRTTVIDAFATFFFLSFSKIAWTSVDLLTPANTRALISNTSTLTFYYNGTVVYFGTDHLPFAIMALLLCLVFVILPVLLLIFYPLKCFQRLINCLNLRSQLLLAVMESFQGCYQDGTEPGTRDYRWFVTVPLIGRFVLLIIYMFTLETSCFAPLAITTMVIIMVLTAIIQPYKKQFAYCSKIDILFWGILAAFFGIRESYNYLTFKLTIQEKVTQFLLYVTAIIPLLYMICVTAYWILSRMRKMKMLSNRIRAWRIQRSYVNIETDFEASLPDRVINPENYQGIEENLQDPVCDNEFEETYRDDTY